jgi:hypothetical protein
LLPNFPKGTPIHDRCNAEPLGIHLAENVDFAAISLENTLMAVSSGLTLMVTRAT